MADAKLDTQVRREQIAEAALSLVAAHGVRRLNMAAVARRVGLVPSGIYRHFKSKSAVLDAVLDLLEKRLQTNVEVRPGRDCRPPERLRECSFATSNLPAKAAPCRESSSPMRCSAIIPAQGPRKPNPHRLPGRNPGDRPRRPAAGVHSPRRGSRNGVADVPWNDRSGGHSN